MRRRLGLLVVPLVLLLVAPWGAAAQTTTPTMIDGSPLNVFTNESGKLQARLDGTPNGEFFPSSSDVGNAGFVIAIDPQNTNVRYGGFNGFMPTPDSGPTLTPGNPATITTVWTLNDSAGSPAIRLTQKLVYTNGQRQFDAQNTVQNISSAPLSFRAWEAADLSIRGSDRGFGFLNGNAPSRFMGGVNQDVGAVGGLVEETPWDAFESNSLSLVSSGVSDSTGPGLDDSISQPPPIDNAAAVQWNTFYPPNTLAAGATAQFNVAWRFIDTLGLSPLSATEQTGNEHVITANVGDLNGAPQGGQTIVFDVAGANTASGKVVTNSAGTAQFSWVGGNVGQDQATAFVDQNNNGVRDANEPQATATVDWVGPAPPIAGTTVGARVQSGKVKVKFPKGVSAPLGKLMSPQWIHAAASGKFVPLTQAMDIPVGSTVDTTHGTVRLLTATSPTTPTFGGGSFSGGQFLVGQGRKGGVAQMSLTGGGLSGCAAPLPKGGAARKRTRRLFSSVHGPFRSRGRNASATVRGTQWLMQDTCKGTQIVVKQGSVTVRDFTLRKNKVVTAGHKYLAKPPKRGKHH